MEPAQRAPAVLPARDLHQAIEREQRTRRGRHAGGGEGGAEAGGVGLEEPDRSRAALRGKAARLVKQFHRKVEGGQLSVS